MKLTPDAAARVAQLAALEGKLVFQAGNCPNLADACISHGCAGIHSVKPGTDFMQVEPTPIPQFEAKGEHRTRYDRVIMLCPTIPEDHGKGSTFTLDMEWLHRVFRWVSPGGLVVAVIQKYQRHSDRAFFGSLIRQAAVLTRDVYAERPQIPAYLALIDLRTQQ